jgi:hypothetical protein
VFKEPQRDACKILPRFYPAKTNRVITAAMIPMAAKFNRLSPWKKGRPMIDILLLSTTVFVVAVVMMVFPPTTATSNC